MPYFIALVTYRVYFTAFLKALKNGQNVFESTRSLYAAFNYSQKIHLPQGQVCTVCQLITVSHQNGRITKKKVKSEYPYQLFYFCLNLCNDFVKV